MTIGWVDDDHKWKRIHQENNWLKNISVRNKFQWEVCGYNSNKIHSLSIQEHSLSNNDSDNLQIKNHLQKFSWRDFRFI